MFVLLRPSNSSWAKVLVGLVILLELPLPSSKQNIELFTVVAGAGSASLTKV